MLVDLSKAFESIDHSVLLSKLKSFGIKGMEFALFCDYLSRCKQRVVVDGHSSEWAHVMQGVPQRSILGLLLFLIYVNDLPAVVAECTVSLYADDVTIYYANKDEGRVSEALNANLQRVATWIETNRLRMNIIKTQGQLMTLGGKLKRSGINVSLNDTAIPKSDLVNYLGVTIDQAGSYMWPASTEEPLLHWPASTKPAATFQ